MPRALLLPSYLGGGYGHIGRCLALSEELKQRGWQTAFALGGHHAARLAKEGHRVYRLRRPFEPGPESTEGPAFTVFSDMNYQLVRDGLHNRRLISASLAEQLSVVSHFKPDLLVVDASPLARILAHLTGLPLAQIVRSANHPLAARLIWWQAPPEGLLSPDPRSVFNPLLEQLGMLAISGAVDLLQGDLYLVPSFPELDPLPQGLPHTHFVGPLTRRVVQEPEVPDLLENIDPDRPLVYVTLGGGAGPVGGPSFYRLLFEALAVAEIQVIASTGARVSPQDLPLPPANFRLTSWAPGLAVIARSSLVVYPGGYGTTMELVRAGVPGLVIPFHTEQESNGRRLAANGAGKILLPSTSDQEQVCQNWPGGRFAYLIHRASDLTPDLLRDTVLGLLNDPGCRENALHLKQIAGCYGGAAQAADLLEGLLETRADSFHPGWDRLTWRQKIALGRLWI